MTQRAKSDTWELPGWKRRREELLRRIEQLKRQGVCYVCHDLKTHEVFHGDHVVYEDDLFRVALDPYPRARGHTIVVFKPHREDVSELTDQEAAVVFEMCVKVVRSLKQALGAEKVYMLTMCDGSVNHLNIHLLPRYAGDLIGLKRLATGRSPIVDGEETAEKVLEVLLNQPDYHDPFARKGRRPKRLGSRPPR